MTEQNPRTLAGDIRRLSEHVKENSGRIATGLGLAALFGLGIGYVANQEPGEGFSDGTQTDAIESVSLLDGANLRTGAFVPDFDSNEISNLLDQVHLDEGQEPIVVDTQEGVRYISDLTGTWYGFTEQQLIDALGPEEASKLEKDGDGIIWVSSQKAVPSYKSSPDTQE